MEQQTEVQERRAGAIASCAKWKKVKGMYWDGQDGVCAAGVLIFHAIESGLDVPAPGAEEGLYDAKEDVEDHYGIGGREWHNLTCRNNNTDLPLDAILAEVFAKAP